MAIPTIFSERGDNAVQAYDWYDFASGAGYKAFYACGGQTSAGKIYFLTTETMDTSNENFYTEANGATTEADFDITINTPQAIASAPCYIEYTQQTAANSSGTAAFTIYHVTAGGTETSLGTITGKTYTSASIGYNRYSLQFTLTGKSFAIGEKLRLTLAVTESGAGNQALVWHDPGSGITIPESGSGRTISTDLKLLIPFRVDL